MSIKAADLDLNALPDDVFRSYVDRAVRGNAEDPETEKLRAMLKAPEVVERTHLALISMKKSVEGQLAARRADYIRKRTTLRTHPELLPQAESEYQSWRAGALRFKSGVEEYLLTVRGNREKPTGDSYYLAYETLRQAIMRHKASVLSALENDEDTDADDVLWAVLEDG